MLHKPAQLLGLCGAECAQDHARRGLTRHRVDDAGARMRQQPPHVDLTQLARTLAAQQQTAAAATRRPRARRPAATGTAATAPNP